MAAGVTVEIFVLETSTGFSLPFRETFYGVTIGAFIALLIFTIMLFLSRGDKTDIMIRFDRLDNAIGYGIPECGNAPKDAIDNPVSLRSDITDIKDKLQEMTDIQSDMRNILNKIHDTLNQQKTSSIHKDAELINASFWEWPISGGPKSTKDPTER